MSAVTDILTIDQLHDLWGAGYTVALRSGDPYDIPLTMIPRGMSYQWNPISPDVEVKEAASGWTPVPYSRHEGVFAPWGTPGDVERGGLRLCEKSAEIVSRAQAQARTKAQQNIDDWRMRAAAIDLTGDVRIGTQSETGKLDTLEEHEIGKPPASVFKRQSTKTIETIGPIPKDMAPYIDRIFKERDRLESEVVRKDRTLAPGPVADQFYAAMDANKGAPWWPTLRAILLPIAVGNVRKSLKETPDE